MSQSDSRGSHSDSVASIEGKWGKALSLTLAYEGYLEQFVSALLPKGDLRSPRGIVDKLFHSLKGDR